MLRRGGAKRQLEIPIPLAIDRFPREELVSSAGAYVAEHLVSAIAKTESEIPIPHQSEILPRSTLPPDWEQKIPEHVHRLIGASDQAKPSAPELRVNICGGFDSCFAPGRR